jgi:polyisoprenoid-binding protein YceI
MRLHGLMTTASIHPAYTTGTWKLDPTHSEIAFTVRHLAISKVRGTFGTFDATIVTAEDPAESTIEAVIDVASVDTNNADRDNHLRTGDFFLIEEHPTMTFRAKGLPAVDGDDFEIQGELTLRGVTKPVTLKGEFGGIATDPWGNTKAAASATTKINRHDFGVSWNAALEAGGFMLGDDVTITMDLQVALQK